MVKKILQAEEKWHQMKICIYTKKWRWKHASIYGDVAMVKSNPTGKYVIFKKRLKSLENIIDFLYKNNDIILCCIK